MKNKYVKIFLVSTALTIASGVYLNLDFDKEKPVPYDAIANVDHSSIPDKFKPGPMFEIYKMMTYRNGEPTYRSGHKMRALNKAMKESKALRTSNASLTFDERGPSNVPGRARALFVDPADATHKTWLAGSVGGGIWKTTDGGRTWVNKTSEFPNLATTTIAYSKSNPDILYTGTGEVIGGNSLANGGSGIFKSFDRGETWAHLPSTVNLDFNMVNSMWVHPEDPDVLLVCTSNNIYFAEGFFAYILKSTDGGTTWGKVFTGNALLRQIVQDPSNASVLYATLDGGRGVIKSTDGGESWINSSNGLNASGRIEMVVSPADPNRLFASVEGNFAVQREDGRPGSDVYYSDDAGANWSVLTESTDRNVDFFNSQGSYDNTILAHPFDKDICYVGGVGIYKVQLQAKITETEKTFAGALEENTTFLDLVNFNSGVYYGSKIAIGTTDAANFTSIEVRFGSGLTQKAHRFTIPSGQGAGVGGADYTYRDYVDVPFQVWDTDAEPERQLMVSFRDQQADGTFNLIANNTNEGDEVNHSREYLYIHAIEYSETVNSSIAANGGHEHEDMYFLWPFLKVGGQWDPNNLPESKFAIYWGSLKIRDYLMSSVADVYGFIEGTNRFEQTTGATRQTGVHPDQHALTAIIHDETAKTWQILNANDGGIYVSNIATDPGIVQNDWTFAGNLMNTTQFYAVDKMPGENRYIGGSQDNGTWMNQVNANSSSTSEYKRALGGDGFGTLWHSQDPSKLLGSIYNLDIRRSTDGGVSWQQASSGISDDAAPFITKLENSHSLPDVVYTAGSQGVFKSDNFGLRWSLTPISSNWGTGLSNVEISEATPDVIWSGNRMDVGGRPHVSVDGGQTFTETSLYDAEELGTITGIASHPFDHKTAYALFCYANSPKILRTKDLGATWEDISGFADASTSTGFPDVLVYDLIVLPHDPMTLWAGTEIGIVESNDDGATWHLLEGDLPRVAIFDMNINEDQLVIGTHGRGIWTYTLPETPVVTFYPTILKADISNGIDIQVSLNMVSDMDSIQVFVAGDKLFSIAEPALGQIDQTLAFTSETDVDVYAVGFVGTSPFTTSVTKAIAPKKEVLASAEKNTVRVYPNPTSDFVQIEGLARSESIKVFDMNGAQMKAQYGDQGLDLRSVKSGVYFIHFRDEDGKLNVTKVVKR